MQIAPFTPSQTEECESKTAPLSCSLIVWGKEELCVHSERQQTDSDIAAIAICFIRLQVFFWQMLGEKQASPTHLLPAITQHLDYCVSLMGSWPKISSASLW